MSPEEWAAFLEVHKGLPRQGPGLPDDVAWAVDAIGLSGAVDVFDAACGPGADTMTLARLLPEARITAVDTTLSFVEQAQAQLADDADRVSVRCDDMASPDGSYDLIWCAGALYFLGVTEGLRGWRRALRPGGHVVFSEPVLLDPAPSAEVIAFWSDYPHITDLSGIEARVTAAGFQTHAHRMIVGAPWEAYYKPMQARIDLLRQSDPDPQVARALDENQLEIDRWRAARDQIAYALLIVSPQ
ncbi:methyltransferase domain-containing protein [uncultured Tateyamaria sp.]|uniref:methyltransferase domain-containing protein n=1 Tax=uncultured Tateyamaria sp. TaxID=455651 RepID=UPI002623A082|nr:class I SAM-dependent methyltransferase [uncultured Tateyamaria sp.]